MREQAEALVHFKSEHFESSDPVTFLKVILPYIGDPMGPFQQMDVDPALVLSNHYQGYPDPSPPEARNTINYLNSVTRNQDRSTGNIARFIKPRGIPIYAPEEGKNRVALFRRYAVPIHAFVVECQFPYPDELELRKVVPFGNTWELHHPRTERNHVLPFPDLVVPLLDSYGVVTGKRKIACSPFATYKQESKATRTRSSH